MVTPCRCCNGEGQVELLGVCPLCDGDARFVETPLEDQSTIEAMTEHILSLLRERKPETVEAMDPALHYIAPAIPRVKWNALGDAVAAREKSSCGSVEGSRWISLRLDGSGFSKAVRQLRKRGILEESGFSEVFAACMRSSLKALMEHFHARLGYTQSDEMIVFISPANVVRGVQAVHVRSGRVTKLTTLAASLVTAHFLLQLAELCCQERGQEAVRDLAAVLPHFDCRLGHYSSWEEARGLLLWRAYDCSVNGVSDAVYQIKGSGKQVQALPMIAKVEWLWQQGKLPLPRHQAYGTVLVKVRRVIDGFNPKLGVAVKTLRGAIETLDGPVLERARNNGLLLPEDDSDLSIVHDTE